MNKHLMGVTSPWWLYWLWDLLGKHYESHAYTGHGDFVTRRGWKIKLPGFNEKVIWMDDNWS
jgi:hypothetical protein